MIDTGSSFDEFITLYTHDGDHHSLTATVLHFSHLTIVSKRQIFCCVIELSTYNE